MTDDAGASSAARTGSAVGPAASDGATAAGVAWADGLAMRLAGRAADLLDELRRRPRHVVLAALVAGLLAAPLEPRHVVLLALAAAALAGRPAVAALAAGAVLAGALGASARGAALERTELTPLLGTTGSARVTLLEQPRPVRYGSTALARLGGWEAGGRHRDGGERDGGVDGAGGAGVAGAAAGAAGESGAGGAAEEAPGDGERVMLRIRQATVWPRVATGAIVRVTGRLRALGPFERHYARKGANAAITVDAATASGQARGGVGRAVDTIRGRAERALAQGLRPRQAALLRGMVLGQDEALDDPTKDAFRASGLAHLLAASGQNVALLLALALPLLAFAGLGLRGRLLGALALIALYVPLAGAGPSIQRAGVMGAATTVAGLAGRPASRWYALLLAAAATLAYNPRACADPGWQLSFAAVAAIALMTAPLSARLRRRGLGRPVADAAAMSFAATLGTMPLLAFHFETVSVVSLPANLLAAPAVAPIMWLGMLAAALGQLSETLALPLNALNAYLLAYLGAVAHQAAATPNAELRVGLGGPAALAGCYAAVGTLALAVRRRAPRD